MLISLALWLPVAPALEPLPHRIAEVHGGPAIQVPEPRAHAIQHRASTLWASGATVDITDDGVVLDGEMTMRFAWWGRGQQAYDVGAALPALACAPTPFAANACVAGPTWSHLGVDAWWVGLHDGLEFGWTISAPPVGPGLLTLGLDVDDALRVRSAGDGVEILSPSARLWTLGGVAAWDADGVALPARLRATDTGIEVEVDDRGARYPIVVDPVLTVARHTLAPAGAVQFGLSVVTCDLNGDGADDVAVGDPATATVRVYTRERFTGGINPSPWLTFTGTSGFGTSLSAGLINADATRDLLIGSRTGEFAVVFADRFVVPTARRFTLPNNATIASSVTAGADFDNDGFGDLAIASDDNNIYLCMGESGPTFFDCNTALGGAPPFTEVSAAEDLNGDGYGDLVLGQWVDQEVSAVFGSAAGLAGFLTLSATMFPGLRDTALFGLKVDASGDPDADGVNEILVANMDGDQLIVLDEVTTTGVDFTIYDGPLNWDYTSSLGVGDLNGDDIDDVAIGARDVSTVVVLPGTNGPILNLADSFSYQDPTGSVTFGDGGIAILDDLNVRAGLIAVGDYGNRRVQVYDGFRDVDGDTYGPDDCNDGNPAINPAATEITGNSVDENCDGLVSCYVDADDDGARTNTPVNRDALGGCSPSGFGETADPLDCNDTNAAIRPSAVEAVGDGVDQNCDGQEICYVDQDDDNTRTNTTVTTSTISCVGFQIARGSDPIDCNDADATISPIATEIPGNAVDNDCNGTERCYNDFDGDGARSGSTIFSATIACTNQFMALATAPIDCDDGDDTIFPGAVETPADGVDSSCDGAEICYHDFDQDGYRSDNLISSMDLTCTDPGYAVAATPLDCNDFEGAFNTVCPPLVISAPQPGWVGVPNTIDINYAPPGATVALVAGRPGSFTARCGATLDIASPNVLGTAIVDANGEARFRVTPPMVLAGRPAVFQAALISTCQVSNSVLVGF